MPERIAQIKKTMLRFYVLPLLKRAFTVSRSVKGAVSLLIYQTNLAAVCFIEKINLIFNSLFVL